MDYFYEGKEQEPIYYTINEIDELINLFKEKFNENYNILDGLKDLRENIRLNPKFKIKYDSECVIKSWIDVLDTTNRAIDKINYFNIKIDIINKKIDILLLKIANNVDYSINDYNTDEIIDSNLIFLYKYRDNCNINIKIIENKYICNDAGYINIFDWRNDCIQNLLNAIN